jgi:PAS domain S-box-containing protein
LNSQNPVNDLNIESRHQLLVDAVTDYAICMLDPTGRIVSWNTGAEKFEGYSAAEIIGTHFSVLYTEEARARGEPKQALDIAVKDGKFETEAWRVRKGGTQFLANVTINPIYDPPGKLIGFAKVTRDVTERTKAREALLESERRFRILVQGVSDYAIYMLDPTGVVTNWNLGAAHIKGYAAEEIVGQHFSRFYAEEDLATDLPTRALATAAKEGRFEAEGWRVRKDGTRFWAGVVIDAIRDEHGELIGYAKITRDLTERRQTMQQLEQARQALFQSQKMEAIGQLTGGVAHDFNNLLTVVVSSLDLLRRKLQDSRDLRILDNALQAAERGSQLTSQLLAFARKQTLRPQAHDPNRLIETFEAILRRAAGDSISVDISLSQDMRQIKVDPTQFEAALLNLVVNARDACGINENCTIKLRTETVTISKPKGLLLSTIEPGIYVRVCVFDTGHGIPKDLLKNVCEPFFTTKEVGKGTGLGLSQVYGFVAQSSGHIDIETEEGKGTSVSLYLAAGEAIVEAEAAGGGRAGTVLIVDDDQQVMNVAVDIFDSIGYDVMTANDATEAIDILMRDRQIDVLFSDVMMPGSMNGVELAREARNLRPEIKILLASGFPQPALEKAGAALGETAFIAKPYRWTEIVDRLRSMEVGSTSPSP